MRETDILKKCRAFNDSNDILYYLIHQRQYDTYAVVCAPCNYLYQNDADQFFGTCLCVSENNISEAMRKEFIFKSSLLGIPMVKTAKKAEGDSTVSLDNYQIRDLPYRHRPDAKPRFSSPFIPAYTCFDCENVEDVIEPRTALRRLCAEKPEVCAFTEKLSEYFHVDIGQIGIAGSAALGAIKPRDYDIVFYGAAEELKRINGIIHEINRRQGVPKSGGLPLPFSFIFLERLVDTLFVYEDFKLQSLCTARLVKENVPFRCRVADDTAALQVEPFFAVDSEDFSYLLIAETFFHAVIQKGDIVQGSGDILRWEHDGKTDYIMLCKNPFSQLQDYTRYFYRDE